MNKKLKISLIVLAAVLLAAVVAFGIYVGIYYHADDAALAALTTTEKVTVTQCDGYVTFSPEKPAAGLIFYPGGKVEHRAYGPLMQAMAQRGVLCVLVEMPFNLAVFDAYAALDIPEQFPQVQNWYLAGHSLGGSMAAKCAAKAPERFRGLGLLAAYATVDLSESGLKVVTVLGDQDRVLNGDMLETNRQNLPKTAVQAQIPGANHAQFGSYGPQKGDGEATIDAEEQIRITANLLAEMMG